MGFQDDALLASRPSGRLIASPSEEIFAHDDHVGTVYEWDDGEKQTVWFGSSVPIAQCVFHKVVSPALLLHDIF